jgi:hypothetical protein
MESTQTIADILARLAEPFVSEDVKWLVAATSRDNKKGRVTPYADPRAYTDRLNEVVTPSAGHESTRSTTNSLRRFLLTARGSDGTTMIRSPRSKRA